MQTNTSFLRRMRSRTFAALVAAVVTALAATPAGAAPAGVPGAASPAEFPSAKSARVAKSSDPWAWSADARAWTSTNAVLPAAVVAGGPTRTITRAQFVAALVKLEQLHGGPYGSRGRSLRDTTVPAPAIPGAAAGSVAARAVALGWMPARRGSFAGGAPVTANEAALAMVGLLGLRNDASAFAGKLRTEVPGSGATLYNASHALIRTLGLRWNVKDPNDELELGPTEALNVAHGAYMLHVAGSRLDSWRLDGARSMVATFDLPTLGANQARILGTAVRQLGQPYVWAGETEGAQAEGHGGFDCSGFTIRVINESGVAAADIAAIGERTTYTQSALPANRRITRAKLQPADAMFFGDNGPSSTPTQNYHAGVYMGNGWFVHSSGGNGGVAIDALDGWWGDEFAWGRRALLRP